ncbi:MAG TPA: D-2-hydroxyacid dehydrogenase [Woeseiaceae bacterium]|nr:D-2-hydroxyacid dehydrogenase [Woeseiaceae bacterium]
MIATPLEAELVERIVAVAPGRVEVLYAPELLPPMRYRGDHRGEPGVRRSADDEARFDDMIAGARILWDIPPDRADGSNPVADAAGLRWVQTTSSGVGPRVRKLGLDERGITITTARGLHAAPLTEFTFMALLAHAKGYEHLRREQVARRWRLYCSDSIQGKTLSIVGMGGIGRRIAATGKAFGMRVNGLIREGSEATADDLAIDAVFRQGNLHAMLGETDALVLCAPETPATRGMLDRAAFDALKPGAVLVNIARGSAVDEPALVAALLSGRLAFAALDVFRTEPLPEDSPLWDLGNVLISPHSASTVAEENERLTELFCRNLARFLAGRIGEMENLFDVERGY